MLPRSLNKHCCQQPLLPDPLSGGARTVPVGAATAASWGGSNRDNRQESAAAKTFGKMKKELLFFLSDGLALNRIPLPEIFCLLLSTSARRRWWLMPCAVTSPDKCAQQLASITEMLGTGTFCHLCGTRLHGGESGCLGEQKALCCEKNTLLILRASS